MNKSRICILLALIVSCLIFTSCNTEADDGNESVLRGEVDGNQTVRVIMPYIYYATSQQGNQQRLNDFEGKINTELVKNLPTDSNINFKVVEMNISSLEDYIEKRNNLLMQDDTPELVCTYNGDYQKESLLNSGAVVDVSSKLNNYQNVYDNFKESYYLPILLKYTGIIVDTNQLSIENMECPPMNWTRLDYRNINDQWLKKHPQPLSIEVFRDMVFREFSSEKLIDADGKVGFSTNAVLNHYKSLTKEIFSKDYTISNDIINHYSIDESKGKDILDSSTSEITIGKNIDKQISYTYADSWYLPYTINILNPLSVYKEIFMTDYVVRPNVILDEPGISLGFLVTANGKNQLAAVKVIDTLLSDESQMDFYKGLYWSPISKAVENQVEDYNLEYFEKYNIDPESMNLYELRNKAIDVVNGEGIYNDQLSIAETKARDVFSSSLYGFIITRPEANDEEILLQLKKLEDSFNLEVSEK